MISSLKSIMRIKPYCLWSKKWKAEYFFSFGYTFTNSKRFCYSFDPSGAFRIGKRVTRFTKDGFVHMEKLWFVTNEHLEYMNYDDLYENKKWTI